MQGSFQKLLSQTVAICDFGNTNVADAATGVDRSVGDANVRESLRDVKAIP
jgi:hypothetical protein